MSRVARVPARCTGNPSFQPEAIVEDQNRLKESRLLLAEGNLYDAIRVLFGLPERDIYTYHAMTAVKLAEVQRIVSLGGANGLHTWYRGGDGSPQEAPPQSDIEAYIAIFSPATSTVSALKNFDTNAKKGSIRAQVAHHLTSTRFVHPDLAATLAIPKCKSPPRHNPYFDFWAWSSRNLEWCGPCNSSARRVSSHHVLPVFMHHFGCVTPSHEALELLRILADGRDVADVGSGNGYWTFMLRGYGLTVHAVDNMQSEWRVQWNGDTVILDGARWLQKNSGGRDMMLLLVYPVVGGGVGGGTEGGFTRGLVDAFRGDTIAVVGTQNDNGYTAFRGMTMDEYMAREKEEWTKVVQIPLPSFAGKDEALFVFQRGERASALQPSG